MIKKLFYPQNVLKNCFTCSINSTRSHENSSFYYFILLTLTILRIEISSFNFKTLVKLLMQTKR